MICTGMWRVSGFLLELAEHRPAQHVGQEDIERHRGRLELLGEIERIGAAHRDQHLEALVAGEIHDDARIVRIVLDDQQDAVARLDLQPIVGNVLDGRSARQRAHGGAAPSASLAGALARPALVGPTYLTGR